MRFERTFFLLPHEGHKKCTTRVPANLWFKDWGYGFRANVAHMVTRAEGPNGEIKMIRFTSAGVNKLAFVRDKLYWDEGFSTPEGFVNEWNTLYPRNRFDPETLGCTIFFEVLPPRGVHSSR